MTQSKRPAQQYYKWLKLASVCQNVEVLCKFVVICGYSKLCSGYTNVLKMRSVSFLICRKSQIPGKQHSYIFRDRMEVSVCKESRILRILHHLDRLIRGLLTIIFYVKISYLNKLIMYILQTSSYSVMH